MSNSNNHDDGKDDQRRQLLTWLAASPLLALAGNQNAFADDAKELVRNFTKRPDPMVWAPNTPLDLISNPKDAINVFDFEPVAFTKVPRAHFAYMASGIDDEVTLRANRSSFLKYQLRPRRLRDVSQVDTSCLLYTSPSPRD